MGESDPAPLAAIMNRLWARHLPEIEQRVAVLETAASAHAEGSLTAELCEHAHAASHKLAGVLGTFGLAEGTVLAREAETLYANGCLSAASGEHASSLASRIRAIVESRTP
jgi:HPt (histidine-containing phosphotransfer) domain-containing protein